jgi:phage terminase small subunit
MKQPELTNKQLLFCKEYLLDLNATASAVRAGYSKATAKEQGYELMKKQHVQDKIKEFNEERMRRVQVDADYVLQELLSIAQDDIKNYLDYVVEPITGHVSILLKDSTNVNTKNISELSFSKDGSLKFKRYSRENALIQLGRHLGLFEDKLTLKTNLEKILSQYSENGVLSEEGLQRLAQILYDHHKKDNNENQ